MTRFKPLKSRIRATFAQGAAVERVDRDSHVLHGVQIALEGEAKGHGVWLDRAFVADVCAAGNAAGAAGVKVRFGHPAMCSDALGTYLGRAKNFRMAEVLRKDGETVAGVLADVEVDMNADRAKWVMDMAESAPDTFGQSIVFTYADLHSLDKNGDRILRSQFDDAAGWDDAHGENRVFAMLGKLLGTDFTDTPAATDGVFSTGTLAEEAERMLDEHPQILDAVLANPDAALQFLTRVGVMDGIESRRVSNLQAEKDREIGVLKKAAEEFRAAAAAEKSRLEHQLKTKCDALAEVEAEVEQLRGRLAETENALAETRERLSTETERYRRLTGAALRPNTDAVPFNGDARARLAALPMHERAAFYRAHRAEIDNRKN